MSGRPVFDTVKFFAALDTIRSYRRMSWRDLAKEADVHSSLLSRMAGGKSPDIDNLMRLLNWSGLDLSNYFLDRPPVVFPRASGGDGRG
jgi:transcriptional regulator with XRE-family HTH domain